MTDPSHYGQVMAKWHNMQPKRAQTNTILRESISIPYRSCTQLLSQGMKSLGMPSQCLGITQDTGGSLWIIIACIMYGYLCALYK